MYLLILSEIKISKGVSVTLPRKVSTDYGTNNILQRGVLVKDV